MALAQAYLVDTNVLLRLSQHNDPQHRLVQTALDERDRQGADLYFSMQNMAEFWNVCTRPVERNGYGLSTSETGLRVEAIELIMDFLPDNDRVYSIWRQIVLANSVRGVQAHDARLAAIMQAYGINHILTLNVPDFVRYTNVQAIHPTNLNAERMQTTYIAMGSNLASWAGPPDFTMAAAASRLESLGRVAARSSLYSTEPVGYADQPRFLNAAVALETGLDPHALLDSLLQIEKEFGRDRSEGIPNGPRTLDLDLLLYGQQRISEPGLEIPHPRLAERAFVLVPLCEIAPNALDVTRQVSVTQLLNDWRSRHTTETDAVVPVQSDAWRTGPGGGDALRADTGAPHPHGGG